MRSHSRVDLSPGLLEYEDWMDVLLPEFGFENQNDILNAFAMAHADNRNLSSGP